MKVLVVDPDPLFSRLLKSKLEKWGHRVTVEHDGGIAYDRVAKEPFRMVVMEHNLPGIDGMELCRRIRKLVRPRYVYIMFYADFAEKDTIMACLEAGADDYLNKPLNTTELQLRIRAGKRLLNMEDMLREGAGMDLSTGVVNGASFREFFRVVMADSVRAERQGTLLYAQVTNYVSTLDAHGFNPTESMMAGLANLLRNIARSSDLVARLSDDTFCVMLQHTNWDKCRPVADKIAEQAQNIAVMVDDGSIGPELEITTSNYPQGDLDYLQILERGERTAFDDTEKSATAANADG
ncbi:MAG: response regulator [Alphaproteobacteria bacterium]|nr:response regulator [Alphaproteobacteria bacterium]